MKLHIRRLTIDDLDACKRISDDRGWLVPREAWADMLGRDGYGVESDGELVATVTCCDYGVMTFLGMMLVHSGVERRGVGTALMRHVMEFRPSTALVATEMGQRLYKTLGFTNIGQVNLLKGALARANGVQTLQAHELTPTLREALIATDARAFGIDRANLLQRAFAHCAEVAIDGDGGFALARDRDVRTIGPVVAANWERSLSLIRALGTTARTIAVCVRCDAGELRDALVNAGLECTLTAPIMVHGPWRPRDGWRVLYSKGTS